MVTTDDETCPITGVDLDAALAALPVAKAVSAALDVFTAVSCLLADGPRCRSCGAVLVEEGARTHERGCCVLLAWQALQAVHALSEEPVPGVTVSELLGERPLGGHLREQLTASVANLLRLIRPHRAGPWLAFGGHQLAPLSRPPLAQLIESILGVSVEAALGCLDDADLISLHRWLRGGPDRDPPELIAVLLDGWRNGSHAWARACWPDEVPL